MAVYKKTEKGMNELLARAPGIDVRLVSVLILVDGVRDSADVNRLAKEVDLPADALDILFHGGFIEKKFKGSATPQAEPRPATPADSFLPKKPDADRQLEKFNALYAYLVEETKMLLGLGGFIHQLRIERASTPLELKALIAPIGRAVEKKHGADVARNFRWVSERLAVAAIADRDL